jgi:hypothetical protein
MCVDDKTKQPDGTVLTEAFGPAKKLWEEFTRHIAQEYAPVT